MNKRLKSFDKKSFIRIDKKFISNTDLKQKLIKVMKVSKIPLNELKETDNSFYIGNNVFFKTKNELKETGIIKVRSKDLIFNNCYIKLKNIIAFNIKGFETNNFNYLLV